MVSGSCYTVISLFHSKIFVRIGFLQWGGWPDYGVPADRWHELDHLFERYRFLRERQTGDEHTIVHCSAGIGRTGTFMSIEVLREHILHAAAPLLQSTASSSSALATSESESASSATPESASATASSADAKATVAAVASSTAGGAWRDQVRISVFDVVDRLRHRRPFMVQTFVRDTSIDECVSFSYFCCFFYNRLNINSSTHT